MRYKIQTESLTRIALGGRIIKFQISNIEHRMMNIEPLGEIRNPKSSHLQTHKATINIEVGAGDKSSCI
jgi:hypothetical protein